MYPEICLVTLLWTASISSIYRLCREPKLNWILPSGVGQGFCIIEWIFRGQGGLRSSLLFPLKNLPCLFYLWFVLGSSVSDPHILLCLFPLQFVLVVPSPGTHPLSSNTGKGWVSPVLVGAPKIRPRTWWAGSSSAKRLTNKIYGPGPPAIPRVHLVCPFFCNISCDLRTWRRWMHSYELLALIYMTNNIGLKTDPCGILLVTILYSEATEPPLLSVFSLSGSSLSSCDGGHWYHIPKVDTAGAHVGSCQRPS